MLIGLVVDVETTGLDWNKHSVIQVGYVAVDMDKWEVVGNGDFLVKPYKEFIVQPKAVAVNNIDVRDVFTNGKSVREIYSELAKIGGNGLMFFVGWNVWFDYMFIQDMLSRIGVDFGDLFFRSPIDVKSIYMSKYKEHVSLQTAADKLGVNPIVSAYHDAGFDAHVTYLVWKKLMGGY